MNESHNQPPDNELTLPQAQAQMDRLGFRDHVSRTIASGRVLTPVNLLDTVREVRTLVMDNAHRIPKARQIANYLGACETIMVEDLAKPEDTSQEKLPLDQPESVETELGGNGRNRRRKAS